MLYCSLTDMDFMVAPPEIMAVASILLLLLLFANRALDPPPRHNDVNKDENMNTLLTIAQSSEENAFDHETLACATLHTFRLSSVFTYLEADLGYWVKPRSTAWFSRFLLDQYDDDRWVSMFRMTKPTVYNLATLLKPAIEKKNTKYRLAILVLVRIACTLFKLTHGCSLFICSEMFAIGRSTVSLVLREVVQAINVALRLEIAWPMGQRLLETEADFRALCGLPGVLGAIDGTHITISKPRYAPGDYYYFKSGGYTLNCQAVVDSKKRFLDLFLGMLGSTNDSRVLRRSTLYQKTMHNTLWETTSFQGFSPFLLGDSGYPLLPWLMVPHPGHVNMPVADRLFNKKLRRGCCVVENAFGILKQSFRELFVKSDLQVTFLPNVIMCCAILHNLVLGQSTTEVERFLHVLCTEGMEEHAGEEGVTAADFREEPQIECALPHGIEKRRQLGVHLAL